MGWYEERFEPKAGRINCACKNCDRNFWVPPCEVHRRHTCGVLCARELSAKLKKSRERECVHCKEKFIPRTTQIACGEGRYCSISCATQVNRQLWDKLAREKATKAFMESIECGRYMPKSGPAHAQWTGGKFVARQRRIKSGVSALQQKRYRKANPEKTREWSSKRNSRKTGRLPKGFVLNLLKLQKSMCPACRTTLKAGYHVDHITPLSKGGKHECLNIQLLCPPCNMRKSAKHSIDFMQEKGFLL